MAKIFTNSMKQPVYYKVGTDSTTGKMMYRRAPFDVVLIDGKLHIQPASFGFSMPDQAVTMSGKDSAEDKQNWREHDLGGYETLEPIVVDEAQMGDGSDNWLGLHAMSVI